MKPTLFPILLGCSVALQGCETVGSSLLGAGIGSAIHQEQDSQAVQTVTQPLERARAAVLAAFTRMGIQHATTSASEGGQRIIGQAKAQKVDVRLIEVTEKATRLSVRVGEPGSRDAATAKEILEQTQRAMRG
jgi:hypothetical protein